MEVIRSFLFEDTNEEKYVNDVNMLQQRESILFENRLFINVQKNIFNSLFINRLPTPKCVF